MIIKELKIVNFLSFVGESKVRLSDFTAVMCCYDKGREDLLNSIKFVLGFSLKDIGFDRAIDLYHSSIVPDSERRYPKIEVSADVSVASSDGAITFTVVVATDELIYIIDNVEVPVSDYTNRLKELKYFGHPGTNKFYFLLSDFYEAINEPEGLEEILTSYFGYESRLGEINEIIIKCKYGSIALSMLKEKRYLLLKKKHDLLKDTVDSFLSLSTLKAKRNESALRQIREKFVDDDELDELPESAEHSDDDAEKRSDLFSHLCNIEEMIMEEISTTRMIRERRYAVVINREVSMKKKLNVPESAERRLQNLNALKNEEEQWLADYEAKMEHINSELFEINNKIGHTLCCIEDLRKEKKSDFTSHGRLMNHVKCGNYSWIVKAAFGPQLAEANIVNEWNRASYFANLLKEKQIETRETFIAMENLSPKVDLVLFSSGTAGVKLNNLLDVQMFLSRLKVLKFIDEIPVVIQQGGLREDIEVNSGMYLFSETGEWIDADGCFGRISRDDDTVKDLDHLQKDLQELREREEFLRESVREMIQQRLLKLCNLDYLENDIFYLRGQFSPRVIAESPEIEAEDGSTQISNGEVTKCSEVALPMRENLLVLPAEDPRHGDDHASLDAAEAMLAELQIKLRSVREKSRKILTSTMTEIVRKPERYIPRDVPVNLNLLSHELRLMELRKLLAEDNVDWFEGLRDWNEKVFVDLKKDLVKCESDFEALSTELKELENQRINTLDPVVRFANDFLEAHIKSIMDLVLSDVILKLHDEFPLQMSLTSWGITRELKDWNTYLQGTAVLATFLAFACFKGRPLLVLDDLEPLFPRTNQDVNSALAISEEGLNIGCERMRLAHRSGNFLKYILRQQSQSADPERGLRQILVLTADDLAGTATSQVVLFKSIPDSATPGVPFEPVSKLVNLEI